VADAEVVPAKGTEEVAEEVPARIPARISVDYPVEDSVVMLMTSIQEDAHAVQVAEAPAGDKAQPAHYR